MFIELANAIDLEAPAERNVLAPINGLKEAGFAGCYKHSVPALKINAPCKHTKPPPAFVREIRFDCQLINHRSLRLTGGRSSNEMLIIEARFRNPHFHVRWCAAGAC